MTRQRLRGLAATVAIIGVVAGIPAFLIAIGSAPWDLDYASIGDLLWVSDDGTFLMLVLTIACWLAWAFVTVALIAEIIAALRGIQVPTLRGLSAPQHATRQLVAIAALAFVAAPGAVATLPGPPAHAATPAVDQTPTPRQAPVPVAEPEAAQPDTTTPDRPATVDYVVKRGDSLWRIAERELGDPHRYPEIVVLNHDTLGDPDFLTPGIVLRIPALPTPATEIDELRSYLVVEHDTLWDIADRELGNPERWPEIYEVSRRTLQPDGARLTDPDLILPGWTLTIPARREQASPAVGTTPSRGIAPDAGAPVRAPRSAEHATGQRPDATPTHTDTSTQADAATTPGWLLPGLTAGGAVLGGCLFLTLRGYRRTQARYRKPGQILAPTPPELRPMEKIVSTDTAYDLEFVERALRDLAATLDHGRAAHPDLTHATLSPNSITLHLATPATLPQPWTGAGTTWELPLGTEIADQNVISPYPLLVSVGRDVAGRMELINLEQFGTVDLTGDPAHTEALARHIAAELALSPWSVLVQVDCVGTCAELAGLDDFRLRHHDDDQTSDINELRRAVHASHRAGAGDPEPYRAIITPTPAAFADLRALIEAPGPRLGVVLMSVAGNGTSSGALGLEVDAGGGLHVAALGLHLTTAGLTSEEARACAKIVDLTREVQPVPIPVFEEPADDLHTLIDQAGALRPELTDVRDTEPAGEGSLLPAATTDYVAAAAATTEDVETLAPIVSTQVRATVLAADPTLDNDLAAWTDPQSLRPKLTLLGPVELSAKGQPPSPARQPVLLELAGYLALHPAGVVSRELSEVFRRSESQMRNDVRALRAWLGADPNTGQPYLPAGDASRHYQETGAPGYQADGLLTDLDLFRRLRARGQSRGAAGLDDLIGALQLISGEPFTQLHKRGWSWLYDDDRIHETAAAAIVDTAHLIATRELTEGDLPAAHQAIEIAHRAVPFDEVCRLDLVKIARANGNMHETEEMLDRGIFNRTDDYVGPIDLPERTGEIVAQLEDDQRRNRSAG